MKYKGRIMGVLLVTAIHLVWIIYGLSTSEYKSVIYMVTTIISYAIEIGLAYIFGRQYDIYRFISERDFLSGLFNRSFIYDIFPKVIKQVRNDEKVNIFLIDINNFKHVNDKMGHEIGDYVIQGLSKCFIKCMSKNDIIARIGGDEFIIIVPHNDVISSNTIQTKIEEELHTLSTEIKMDISVSIGKSVYPDDAESLDGLISIADKDMYSNKSLFHKLNRLTV